MHSIRSLQKVMIIKIYIYKENLKYDNSKWILIKNGKMRW